MLLKPETERYLHLDFMRFIASYAIVMYHFRESLVWAPSLEWINGAMRHFSCAVDLFFVISGIVIHELYESRLDNLGHYATYLRRRFARIYPLHLLTLAIVLTVALMAAKLGRPLSSPEHYSPACLLPNLTMTHALGLCRTFSFNVPSWSISAEMTMYVIAPLLIVFARRGWLAWVGWAALVAVLSWWFGESLWERSFDLGAARALPSFLLGMLLSANKDFLQRIPAPPLLLAASGLLFAIGAVADVSRPWDIAAVYAIVVFAFAADCQQRAGSLVRSWAGMGRLTYSMYMWHAVLQLVIVTAAHKFVPLSPLGNNLLVASTAVIIVPGVGLASLFLFEEPMRRWLSGRSHSPVAKPKPATAET
jgi:peptidoglycan/LPS O-acetylase OafA/YrhL